MAIVLANLEGPIGTPWDEIDGVALAHRRPFHIENEPFGNRHTADACVGQGRDVVPVTGTNGQGWYSRLRVHQYRDGTDP